MKSKCNLVLVIIFVLTSLISLESCKGPLYVFFPYPIPNGGGGDNPSVDPGTEPKPEIPDVVGVAWNYGEPSTVLYRLYPNNEILASISRNEVMVDPNSLVTVSITEEPVSSYSGNPGSSPFDVIMPWSGMKLVAMAEGGTVIDTIEEGESISAFVSEHSDSTDLMVYLPDMYYRVINDAENEIRYYYVSDAEFEGAELHPASGHYIARYDSMNPEKTKSGWVDTDIVYSRPAQEVARWFSLDLANSMISNKGNGYYGLMLSELSYVQMMYIIEYADMNIQERIGVGQNIYIKPESGITDDMPYHTGVSTTRTDTKNDISYRYIEGLLGYDSTADYINGFVYIGDEAYFTDDIGMADITYSDVTTAAVLSGWKSIGALPDNGYIKKLQYNAEEPWLIGIPEQTDTEKMETSYTSDAFISPESNAAYLFCLSKNSLYSPYGAGLWHLNSLSANISSQRNTCRICYAP